MRTFRPCIPPEMNLNLILTSANLKPTLSFKTSFRESSDLKFFLTSSTELVRTCFQSKTTFPISLVFFSLPEEDRHLRSRRSFKISTQTLKSFRSTYSKKYGTWNMWYAHNSDKGRRVRLWQTDRQTGSQRQTLKCLLAGNNKWGCFLWFSQSFTALIVCWLYGQQRGRLSAQVITL